MSLDCPPAAKVQGTGEIDYFCVPFTRLSSTKHTHSSKTPRHIHHVCRTDRTYKTRKPTRRGYVSVLPSSHVRAEQGRCVSPYPHDGNYHQLSIVSPSCCNTAAPSQSLRVRQDERPARVINQARGNGLPHLTSPGRSSEPDSPGMIL